METGIKRKVLFAILIIYVILFSSGCTRGKSPGQAVGQGVITEKAYIGTQGIIMNFLQDMPPSRIYDSVDDINILVEIQNKGAYTSTGTLHLTGFDPNIIIMGSSTGPTMPILEGKTAYNPEGDRDTISFTSYDISLPEGTDSYKPRFLITSCYEYETKANPMICIDPKYYEVSVEEKACQVRDVGLSGGQGAPVAVTNVRVDSVKDKVHFRIDVSNVGGGKVLQRESIFGQCPFSLQYEDLDKVAYDVELTGASVEKCSPWPEVRLVNGRGTIYCTFNIPTQNTYAYQTPLKITLDYGYMDSISKDVEIIKVPT